MRYFGGKVGLLETLFDEAWNHINVRVEKALETTAAAGNRESLLVAIQTVVTALARDSNLASLLVFEGRRMRGSAPRVRLSRGFVAFSETIHRLIRNAQTTGEIDPRFDTLAVTSALLGAAESLIRDRSSPRGAAVQALPSARFAAPSRACSPGCATSHRLPAALSTNAN